MSRRFQDCPRIVALGGGTGLSTMLRGLKAATDAITAIVTVTDDGGSSGRLRKTFDIVPPGDIRNCLVALSEAGPTLEALMQYRFSNETDFPGHSFGNLLLTVLTQITGDFRAAVREASQLLRVRGQVLPATDRKVALVATHQDKSKSTGEVQIAKARRAIRKIELKPVPAPIHDDIHKAIVGADLIVLGPGSLFTSVIPNCLVPGMVEALIGSPAPKVYVCNVMTQPGETAGYSVADHVAAIERHARAGLLDFVIVNDTAIDDRLVRKYEADAQMPVPFSPSDPWPFRAEVVTAPLASQTDLVRHDPRALAALIVDLAQRKVPPTTPLPPAPPSATI